MIFDAASVEEKGDKEQYRVFAGVVLTRLVSWPGPPAVVRAEARAEVIVAIPRGLPCHKILDLACLVLSDPEYAELRQRIQPERAEIESRSPLST